MPVHSLDWNDIDEVQITHGRDDWKITITDPTELRQFSEFARRGRYESIIKSGSSYHICVGIRQSFAGYYIHGNAFGRSPGAAMQTAFRPSKPGFWEFFGQILNKYGHPVERIRVTSQPST